MDTKGELGFVSPGEVLTPAFSFHSVGPGREERRMLTLQPPKQCSLSLYIASPKVEIWTLDKQGVGEWREGGSGEMCLVWLLKR